MEFFVACFIFFIDGQERKDMVFTCWRWRAGTRPGGLDHKSVGKNVWSQTGYYQAVTSSHSVKEKHIPYKMKIPASIYLLLFYITVFV